VTASVNMTVMDMGVAHPVFKDMGDGSYAAEVRFAMPGPWRIAITATPPGGQPATKTVDYAVVK
jgi:hypothetical protein